MDLPDRCGVTLAGREGMYASRPLARHEYKSRQDADYRCQNGQSFEALVLVFERLQQCYNRIDHDGASPNFLSHQKIIFAGLIESI
jgi:hypothetical protein